MLSVLQTIYNKHQITIGFILLFAALLYTFSFFLWNSLDDVYFWYYSTPFYKYDFLECGFLWFGNIFREYVSNHFFTYRLLGWFCGIISITLVYFTAQKRNRKKDIGLLGIGVLSMSHMSSGSFCPDALTFLLLIFIAVILYSKSITYKTLFALSLLSAFSISVRFPNILILPLLSIYLYVASSSKRHIVRFSTPLLYVSISAVTYLVLISLIYGNTNFNCIINKYLLPATSSSDSSHGIMALLNNYASDILSVFKVFIPFTIIVLFNSKLQKVIKSKTILSLSIFAISILLLHYFGKDNSSVIAYNHKIYSLFIAFLLTYPLIHKETCNKKNIILSATIISIGFIACAGSNTGFSKIYPFFASIFPFAIINLRKNKQLNTSIVSILASICLFSTISFFRPKYPHCSWRGDGKWLTAIQDYRNFLNYGNYVGFLEDEDFERVTHEIKLYEKYGTKDHTYFYGNPSAHESYGILDTAVPYKIPYYMDKNDKVAINILLENFEHDTNPVLFDYTGSDLIKSYMKDKAHKTLFNNGNIIIYK